MKYLDGTILREIMEKAHEFDIAPDPSGLEMPLVHTKDNPHGALDPQNTALYKVLMRLSVEQRHELVALVWVGRCSYIAEEWDEAYENATGADPSGEATPMYLMGIKELGNYVAKGFQLMESARKKN